MAQHETMHSPHMYTHLQVLEHEFVGDKFANLVAELLHQLKQQGRAHGESSKHLDQIARWQRPHKQHSGSYMNAAAQVTVSVCRANGGKTGYGTVRYGMQVIRNHSQRCLCMHRGTTLTCQQTVAPVKRNGVSLPYCVFYPAPSPQNNRERVHNIPCCAM
jgi:hypothetical protein